jgi:aminoglycoside 3-N-acetyltransferase
MLTDDLAALGLKPGDLVMVHASMRAVGGRAEAVVQAILDVLGPEGTLMVYVDFEPTEEVQGFDLARSPAMGDHGVFAEVVRLWPGAIRSANPGASMVAVGARAARLCADHPLNYGYGPGTPLARLVEAQGKVLLLGSHLEHVTLLHHAEHLARLPNKRVIRVAYEIDGETVEIEEFDTSDGVVEAMPEGYFGEVMRAFVAAGQAEAGPVGGATALLMSAAGLTRFAVETMERELG